jgi:hypothetical protein
MLCADYTPGRCKTRTIIYINMFVTLKTFFAVLVRAVNCEYFSVSFVTINKINGECEPEPVLHTKIMGFCLKV